MLIGSGLGLQRQAWRGMALAIILYIYITQALARAQALAPPLTWQTCRQCPEPPEVAFSGTSLWRGNAVTDTLHLGRPNVPERASQNTSVHRASLLLPPA